MNRRGFLKWLAAGTAAIVGAGEIDVDRLLWVPGEKTIFLPPEKKLVDGAEAQRIYNYYVSSQVDLVGLSPKSPLVGREVRTAVGLVAVDAFENVVALNGRVVSAREAAELRAKMFTRHGPSLSGEDLDAAVSRVITERIAAGWADPVSGSAYAKFNGFRKHNKIDWKL